MSNMNGSDDRKPKSVVEVRFDLSKDSKNNRLEGDIRSIDSTDKSCQCEIGQRVCAKNVGMNILNEFAEGDRCYLTVECEIISNSIGFGEPMWYACRVMHLISKEIVSPAIANSGFVRKLDAIVNRLATESINKKALWLDLINSEDLDPSEPSDMQRFNDIYQSTQESNVERGTSRLETWLNAHLPEITSILKAEFAKGPEPEQSEPEPPLPLLDEPVGPMAAAFEAVGITNGNGNGLEAALAAAKAMDEESHGTDTAITKSTRKSTDSKKVAAKK